MNKAELEKLKKDELLKIAKKNGVKADSSSKKEAIIKLILDSTKKEKSVKAEEGVAHKPRKKKSDSKVSQPNLDDSGDIMKGESKKFEIEDKRAYMEPSYELVGEETYELPQYYGETKIILMVQDPYWMHAYWEINSKTRKKFRIEKGKHNENMTIRVFGADGKQAVDISINDDAHSWYFKVPESAKAYYCEIGYIDEKGNFKAIARSNTVSVPTDKVAPYDEEWKLSEKEGEEIFKKSGGYILHKQVGSQSLAEWAVSPNAMSSGGFSGGSGSGGVAGKKPPKKQRGFWAELHTELIVYGATEPDATVTVGGVPTKLSPNGTFSIRFYLKDGEHSIPFVATSNDGVDTIEITPFVAKNTVRKERKNK
jgi:hypothetical protein